MKLYKRLFAALLSLTMVLSFMPAMAFAEGTEETWGGGVTNDTIIVGLEKGVVIGKAYDYVSFSFIPEESGTYSFSSSGTCDPCGRVLDFDEEVIAQNDDIEYEVNNNFNVEFEAEAGEEYYLQAALFENSTGSFYVEVNLVDEDDNETGATERWSGVNLFENEEINLDYDEDLDEYYAYEPVSIENPYDYAGFTFTPTETGYYCFKTSGESNTVGRVMDYDDPEYADLYLEDDSSGDDENFSIVFKAEEYETYYLQAAMYDGETGDFVVELEPYDPGMWNGKMYGPYTISVNSPEEVDPDEPRDYFRFKFTPSASGKYIFRSTGSEDTCGRVLDENENVIGENDDINEQTNRNFSITFSAQQGKTYYLDTCMYRTESGLYDVEVVKAADPISIARASVSNIVTKTYTGRAITQSPVVKVNGVTLRPGVDYTLSYVGNVRPTTAAYVIITGRGNYTGTINRAFAIRPVVPGVNLSKVAKGSKSFTAKWPQANAAVQKQFTGYQIQYGTSKYFLNGKIRNTTKKSAKQVKVSRLKKKKTYYVRIRRYLVWNGQILYSGWSAPRKVKTK